MTITMIAVGFALVAGGVYAVWRTHEEQKAAERFETRMKTKHGGSRE